ncbi:hypothetical protein TGPRC2_213530 [Toxoplasma gondii TgCatPRC2]|uniref:Uncharacterized protein n=1 Tax=Toxoplasma gondii TgCatPRC2 TaxID=1130821 RepID=A0A151HHG2_TOXGO|nr:hypothetical protein TGPRC2_213530 [Toxoplasma gondii TgCatPRC2]
MGNVCGKGGFLHSGVEVDLEALYSSSYVAEGNKKAEETALKHFAKMTEAEWNIVMTKGPCGWRMRLPPKPATNRSSVDVESKHDRQFAAEKSGTKDEGRSRIRSFRESVALVIAPGSTINTNTPRSVRGCEVDIIHEGCCTVRFDTLNPYNYDEEDDDEESMIKTELYNLSSPVGKEHLTAGKKHILHPKPVILQSTLPLPPQEGDVLGVLLCRRTGTVLFLLNGAPIKAVSFPDIILNETDPSSFTAAEDHRPPPSAPDIYVTIGVIGRGECEINFGGKTYTAHGYIKDISGGIIRSNAPIQARVFGQRLANFSQMLAELQLFYQIHCPVMLPKAKGMVVMNISRREVGGLQKLLEQEFEEELKANYGKSLQDIERINDLLRRRYQADLNRVSLRRKQSVERMLTEYHRVHRATVEATKIDQLAEQALTKPKAVDAYLRDKYGNGINILLQKRLEQIYDAYAPENRSEIPILVQTYPLFDDEFQLYCKLKVKYNLDLFTFSPLDSASSDLAAIRKNLRPKMPKKLQLLEGEELPTGEGLRGSDPATSRRKSRRVDATGSMLAKERKSVRRASRAVAGMAAAAAAATAAAQAAENAAAAAAAAAANVKEHDLNKEKMREAREERRKERDLRRKSRLERDTLKDVIEQGGREQDEEGARANPTLKAVTEDTRNDTVEAEKETSHTPLGKEGEKESCAATLKVGNSSEEELEPCKHAKKPSAEAADQKRHASLKSQDEETETPAADETGNSDRPAHGRQIKSVRISTVALPHDTDSSRYELPSDDEERNNEENSGRVPPHDEHGNNRDESETIALPSTEDQTYGGNPYPGAQQPQEEPDTCGLFGPTENTEDVDEERNGTGDKEPSPPTASSPSGEREYTNGTQRRRFSPEYLFNSADITPWQRGHSPTRLESRMSSQGVHVFPAVEPAPAYIAPPPHTYPLICRIVFSPEVADASSAAENGSVCNENAHAEDSSPLHGEDNDSLKRENKSVCPSSLAPEVEPSNVTSASELRNQEPVPLRKASETSLSDDEAERSEATESVDPFEDSLTLHHEDPNIDQEDGRQNCASVSTVLMETAKGFVEDVVRRSSQLTGLDLVQNLVKLQSP